MNKSDSERLATILEVAGYEKSAEEEADLIIVLACSVRQSAIDRIWGKINQWNHWKEKKPLLTILSGCVTSEDKKKFRNKFDYILTIDELTAKPLQLISLLKEKLPNNILHIAGYFSIHPKYESSFQAYVPISTGCNNFCTYCVVPYTRGREKSRPANEIISEVKELVAKGYKEITLLGQNVNSYGPAGKTTNQTFINLLKKIDAIPGDFWFFFITNHPKDMSGELIQTLPKLKKAGHYIHLPVQSGDDEILKRMNRHYTASHYLNLVKKIRESLPDVCLSTDIIVGFPGETKVQFQNTTIVMEQSRFDMAYIAQYSPRSGTAADKLKDDVPKQEKKQREKILTEILKKTALKNNQKYIGKIVDALVVQKLPNRGGSAADRPRYLAKTRTFKNIKFQANANLTGQFIKLKITHADIWGLEGALIK